MTLVDDVYGRRTLEFVEAIQSAQGYVEICDLVVKEMAWYGLTFVTSWSVPGPGEDFRKAVALNTRPANYVEHYNRSQYVDRDPVVSAMRQSLASLSWSDVKRLGGLNKEQRFIIEEGRDFGADDGLTIPVITTSGCIGVFSPCGKKPDLSPRARSAIEIAGIYAQQALHREAKRIQRTKEHHIPLTPRERDVMRWVALGKTDDEIGSILGVNHETVKSHLKNVRRKLNATNRSYAIVQALRFGELSI